MRGLGLKFEIKMLRFTECSSQPTEDPICYTCALLKFTDHEGFSTPHRLISTIQVEYILSFAIDSSMSHVYKKNTLNPLQHQRHRKHQQNYVTRSPLLHNSQKAPFKRTKYREHNSYSS